MEIEKIKGNLSSFIEQAAPKFVVLVCVKLIAGIACIWAPIPKEKSLEEKIRLKSKIDIKRNFLFFDMLNPKISLIKYVWL